MQLSAAPIIYILIFVAVLMLVEPLYRRIYPPQAVAPDKDRG